MEPIEYVRILKRRWWIIATAVFLALVVVFITTPAKQNAIASVRSYRAVNSLLASPATGASVGPAPKIESIAFFVTAGSVPKKAAEKIGYTGDPAILATQVKAEADGTVGALKIEVTDSDGPRAAKIANAFADEFVAFLAERAASTYQSTVDATNKRLNDAEERIRSLDAALIGQPTQTGLNTQADLTRAQRNSLVGEYGQIYGTYQRLVTAGPPGAGFYSVQPATPIPFDTGGFQPPSSRKGRFMILGLLALFLSVGLAIAVDRIDTRVRTKREAESAFDLPVLAEVPLVPRRERRANQILVVSDPGSQVAEQYRSLRTHLLFLRSSSGHIEPTSTHEEGNGHVPAPVTARGRVILISSPAARDGKTTTVANLAASFAEWGLTVLILGCDFQNPSINDYFGVEHTPGLADLSESEGQTASLRSILKPSKVHNVWVAPAGRPHERRSDLRHMPTFIEEARHLVDVVIIDSGPMLAVSDATELLPVSDAVVVVARSGKTSVDSAKRTAELLRRFRAPVLGVALIGVSEAGPQSSQSMSSEASRFRRMNPLTSRQHVTRASATDAPEPQSTPADPEGSSATIES